MTQNGKRKLLKGDGPFRPNVAALIVKEKKGRPAVLVGERVDSAGTWQWPQGGIDKGESELDALHREVYEETGLEGCNVLYRFPFTLTYYFPVWLKKRFKPYIGQTQTYFILHHVQGRKPDVNGVKTREFKRFKWLYLDKAPSETVWFKAEVYGKAVEHARAVIDDLDWRG